MREPVGPVLVVDDDEDYRTLLCHRLEGLGYSIREASDGAKAYQIASRELVALMILDIVMPDMDGLETITRLRRHGFRTPILAISGVGRGREYLDIAARLGADAKIEKTRPMTELLTAVVGLLGEPAPGRDRCPALPPPQAAH
jgi:CheY-like chemotaxis protein